MPLLPRKLLILILFLMLLLSNISNAVAQKNERFFASGDLSFLEDYELRELPVYDSISIWNPYAYDSLFADTLTKAQQQILRFDQMKVSRNLTYPAVSKVLYRVRMSDKVICLVTVHYIPKSDRNRVTFSLLNTATKLVETIAGSGQLQWLITQEELKTGSIRPEIVSSLSHFTANNSRHAKYLIEDTQYFKWKPFDYPFTQFEKRMVKRENGVAIKDTFNHVVGHFDYGEIVQVAGYSSDSITITRKGKAVKSRKAYVITDMAEYNRQLFVPSDQVCVGYIPEVDLFGPKKAEMLRWDWEVRAKAGYTGPTTNFYWYPGSGDDSGVFPGSPNWEGGSSFLQYIDRTELLWIDTVNFDEYKDKVVKENTYTIPFGYRDEDAPFHKTVLQFDNGETQVLQDTQYLNSEVKPYEVFYLFDHEVLPNTYLVRHHFYDSHQMILLDKAQGDTLQTFPSYPFVSPNGKLILCVASFRDDYDYNDYNGTSFKWMSVDGKKNLKLVLNAYFTTWIIWPEVSGWEEMKEQKIFEKQTIYWLSNNDFIIRVVDLQQYNDWIAGHHNMESFEDHVQFKYLKVTLGPQW